MALVAGVTVALAAAFVVLGIPSALVVRRAPDGRVALVADALPHGLVWLCLAVTGWAWLRGWGLGVVLSAWAACVVVAALERRPFPALQRRPWPRADLLLGAGWVVVLVVALALRLRDENFLPWIGDMGAYVNWANQLAHTGVLHASWPPLFPSYLAVASAVLGTAHAGIGLPVLGLVLVVGVARAVDVLGAPRIVVLAGGALVAVQLQSVWFSTFPASEALNAPVFVLWVTLLLLVLRGDGRRRLLAAVGVVALALTMLRGDAGITLVPLGVGLVVVCAVSRWRVAARGVAGVWFVSFLAALVGYWYGITRITQYYVTIQLGGLLPGRVMSVLTTLGVFRPRLATAAGLLVGAAVVWGVWTVLARRLLRGRAAVAGGARATRVLLLLVAAGWVALCAALAVLNGDGLHVLLRAGIVLVGGAVAALVLAAYDEREDLRVAVGVLGLVALFYTTFEAYRLGFARAHGFYLYWDRYLFSEVLPLLLVLTCVALWLGGRRLAAEWARRRAAEPGVPRAGAVTGALAAAVAVAMVVPSAGGLALAVQRTFLSGAYALTARLADDVTSAGPHVPVVWVASSDAAVPYWPFVNTWMGFAKPLTVTFGLPVADVRTRVGGDFAPDAVLDTATLQRAFACTGSPRVVVLEAQTGGQPAAQRLAGSGYTFTSLLSDEQAVDMLTQPPVGGWQRSTIHVEGWVVTPPAAPESATLQSCRGT